MLGGHRRRGVRVGGCMLLCLEGVVVSEWDLQVDDVDV